VLDGAGCRHYCIYEQVAACQFLKIETVCPLAQFLNPFGQLGEPLLAPLAQPPAKRGDER